MSSSTPSLLRKYELVAILHPDVSEDEQKAIFKKTKEIIQQYKGEINHIDTWGKRRLANPIDKMTRGQYFHMTFEVLGSAIAELERNMRINEKILRFQHTRIDDRESLTKFVEGFKNSLVEAANRERERDIKNQQRKAARADAMRAR